VINPSGSDLKRNICETNISKIKGDLPEEESIAVTSSCQHCSAAKSIVQRRLETEKRNIRTSGDTTGIRRKFPSLRRSQRPSCNPIRWRDAARRGQWNILGISTLALGLSQPKILACWWINKLATVITKGKRTTSSDIFTQ